jgi:hypothetical protein
VKMTSQTKLSIASKLTKKTLNNEILKQWSYYSNGIKDLPSNRKKQLFKESMQSIKTSSSNSKFVLVPFFLSWRRMAKWTCDYQHLCKCLHISYIALTLPNVDGCNK